MTRSRFARTTRPSATTPLPHGLAHHRKGFLPNPLMRHDIVGAIQISLVNLFAWNERVDFDGVGALDRNGVEFIIVHRDVSVPRVFVAAAFVRAIDRLACNLIDELLAQAVAGLLVDLAERYPLGRCRPCVEGDGARHKRQLEVAFPIRTRGHHGCLLWLPVPPGHRPRLRTTLLGEAQVGAGLSVDASLLYAGTDVGCRFREANPSARRG